MKVMNTKPYWVCLLKCTNCGRRWEEEIPVGYAVRDIDLYGLKIVKDDVFAMSFHDKFNLVRCTCPNCYCSSSLYNISDKE